MRFVLLKMAGELFRNLSEKLLVEGACPRFGVEPLWCRAPKAWQEKGKKKGSRCNREPEFSGGPSGTRTPNQLIKSQLLYQLS